MAINLYNASQKNKVEKLINPISNCAYPGNLTTYKEDYFSMDRRMIQFTTMELQKDCMYILEKVFIKRKTFHQ